MSDLEAIKKMFDSANLPYEIERETVVTHYEGVNSGKEEQFILTADPNPYVPVWLYFSLAGKFIWIDTEVGP